MALDQNRNTRPAVGRPTPLNISLNKKKQDLDDLGLGLRFFSRLRENRDKICQVDAVSGVTESKGTILNRSIQVAEEMQARGIQENDIVLICSRYHRDQSVVLLSSLLIGAIIAPIDPDISIPELNSCLVLLKPKMIFCDARIYGQIENILQDSKNVQVILFGGRVDRLCFEKLLIKQPSANFKSTVVIDPRTKIAFIVATQGISGAPRLVCISHHAVRLQLAGAESILKGSEKILSYFPLSCITQVILVCYCFDSLAIRIIPSTFHEKGACKLIHDLGIDSAILGTHNAMLLVNHPSLQDYDISCLHYIYVGETATAALNIAHLRAGFHTCHILQWYGLTELGGLVCGFSKDEYSIALTKPGSVGRPLPGFRIKLVDQSGLRVKPGKRGEVQITGPAIMLGYYNNASLTHAVIDKGYVKTGDIGLFDEDGYLYIHGRASDHIIMNGHNVLPTDIENIILMHPLVLEAVIVGDEKETVACIVKKEDSNLTNQVLLEFLNERLPKIKIPTRFKFMDNLPKTSAGKVKEELLSNWF